MSTLDLSTPHTAMPIAPRCYWPTEAERSNDRLGNPAAWNLARDGPALVYEVQSPELERRVSSKTELHFFKVWTRSCPFISTVRATPWCSLGLETCTSFQAEKLPTHRMVGCKPTQIDIIIMIIGGNIIKLRSWPLILEFFSSDSAITLDIADLGPGRTNRLTAVHPHMPTGLGEHLPSMFAMRWTLGGVLVEGVFLGILCSSVPKPLASLALLGVLEFEVLETLRAFSWRLSPFYGAPVSVEVKDDAGA
ncbi:hypothetical protein V8F33_006335 [Rhypophila sp. PSN 637]